MERKWRRPSEGMTNAQESLEESALCCGIRNVKASHLYVRAKEGIQWTMASEADGMCAGGMCSSVLHNLYDTKQYGKWKQSVDTWPISRPSVEGRGVERALDGPASGQEARCVSVGSKPTTTTTTAVRSNERLWTSEGVNNLRCSFVFHEFDVS